MGGRKSLDSEPSLIHGVAIFQLLDFGQLFNPSDT